VEINVHYEFIGEYDGIYMYWVTWGDGEGKMVQLTEEDLEDDDP
jgi:hypothetical protein